MQRSDGSRLVAGNASGMVHAIIIGYPATLGGGYSLARWREYTPGMTSDNETLATAPSIKQITPYLGEIVGYGIHALWIYGDVDLTLVANGLLAEARIYDDRAHEYLESDRGHARLMADYAAECRRLATTLEGATIGGD